VPVEHAARNSYVFLIITNYHIVLQHFTEMLSTIRSYMISIHVQFRKFLDKKYNVRYYVCKVLCYV